MWLRTRHKTRHKTRQKTRQKSRHKTRQKSRQKTRQKSRQKTRHKTRQKSRQKSRYGGRKSRGKPWHLLGSVGMSSCSTVTPLKDQSDLWLSVFYARQYSLICFGPVDRENKDYQLLL